MSCFRTCALDSKSTEDVTKRWGMLNIVNQLFKIYFRVNKLHLCKPLIRAIESSPLKDRSVFVEYWVQANLDEKKCPAAKLDYYQKQHIVYLNLCLYLGTPNLSKSRTNITSVGNTCLIIISRKLRNI